MKTLRCKNKALLHSNIPGGKLLSTLLVLAFTAPVLWAENVFITSYYGNTATTQVTPAPHSTSTGFTLFGASSASQSTATPPPGPAPRRIIYGNTAGAQWSVTPADGTFEGSSGTATFSAMQNIGVYKIYITKGQTGNASTNIVVGMTATGGSLADTNGVEATEILLDAYTRFNTDALHKWLHVGYITNDTVSPTITFSHVGGDIDDATGNTEGHGGANRWYVDAVRFEFLDQCAGVVDPVGVGGPLAQDQTFVNVFSIADGATNVTVYANGMEIGQANSATGFEGGALSVPTTPLNKGEIITAQQTKDGCDSLLATSGPVVGGGPNPQIRAFLGLWRDSRLEGPIGQNVITNNLSTNYFLKATGLIGGFATAFTGGETLFPSQCWQTVTFHHDTDANFVPNGTVVPVGDPFAALSGLAFSIDDTSDSGPFDIYIDEIKNGEVVIESFEGYEPGSVNTLNAPNAAPLPTPGSTFLSTPNSSVISQDNVFEGTNACRIQWQWADSSEIRWVHVMANASTNSGKHYPQIDTTKPITVRYLVLPVGETTNILSLPTVPVNQTRQPGDSVTFSVEAAGEAPFSYQWRHEGGDIPDATNSSYTRSNLEETDAGIYSVTVFNGSFMCTTEASALLTVSTVVPPPTLNFSVSDNQITLTWEGGFTLQSATEIDGTWSDVTSVSGYTEPLNSSTTKFFQLRQSD